MSEKVGIILVNYKDYVNKFLAECRDSLKQQSYPDFNVYIVDNASSEESRRYIRNHYPEAIIVPRPDGNYSAANNAGIKKAGEDGCRYMVIANMDTRFDPDWLGSWSGASKASPTPGSSSPKCFFTLKTRKNGNSPG